MTAASGAEPPATTTANTPPNTPPNPPTNPNATLDASLLPAWRVVLSALGRGPGAAFSPSVPVAGRNPRPDDAPGAPDDTGERLLALARLARVRIRRVALSHRWYVRDTGPLIGFLDDGRAVALLPRWAGGYVLVDAERGIRRSLTPVVAGTLASFGYLPYRTLPDRTLTLWDIAAFCGRQVWRDLLLVLLIGVAMGTAGAALAVSGELLVDTLLPTGDPSRLLDFGAAMLATTVAVTLLSLLRILAMSRAGGRMHQSLQAAMWDRLLILPATFFRTYPAGELGERAAGVHAVQQILTGTVLAAIMALITSVASWALLFHYDALLASVSTGVIVFYALVAAWLQMTVVRRREALLEQGSKLASLVFQILGGVARLRATASERRAFDVWRARFGQQHALSARIERHEMLLQAFLGTSSTMVLLVVLAILAALPGRLTLGEVVAFSTALAVVLGAVLQVTFAVPEIAESLQTFARAAPIIKEQPEVAQARRRPTVLRGAVDVRSVSCRYGEDSPLVLDNVALRAEPGEFIAVVGPSGAGKSTLFRLLLGFETPLSGQICYDGEDLASLDVLAVRRQLGVVLQDGKLIPGGTIFENIAGGRGFTLGDAWESARAAGLAADIEQMPMGMHTFIAEGASTFSGGQRQRLMIARAIINRPSILLLDEATSALDNVTQAQVSRSVEQLRVTRIVIAHRLSTIRHADRIYVLERGRVVQIGSYAELMAEPGLFRELAERQLA